MKSHQFEMTIEEGREGKTVNVLYRSTEGGRGILIPFSIKSAPGFVLGCSLAAFFLSFPRFFSGKNTVYDFESVPPLPHFCERREGKGMRHGNGEGFLTSLWPLSAAFSFNLDFLE